MKTCIGELEAAVKGGKQEEVDKAQQQLLAEGIITRFACLLSTSACFISNLNYLKART